jgi:hypothetical protein
VKNHPSSRALLAPRALAVSSALLFACSNTLDGGDPGGSAAGTSSTSGAAGASASGASGSSGASGGTSQGGGGSGAASGASGAGVTGGTGPVVPDPPPFQPAAGMLRRLTRAQFRNAVRDVFGVDVDATQLEADSWNGDFAVIGASSVVTSEGGVEKYHAAIESAVTTVFADSTRRSQFIGCTPASSATDACVRGFIQAKGRIAWRRALESAEVDRLASVAAGAAAELGSAVEGVRWVTVALFTSPNFLYRAELGAPSSDGSLRYTGYETAARLAFLVANSGPNSGLLDQAASGALATAEGRRAAATELLATTAGREAVGAFAEEYMRLDRVLTQAKDASLFPEYGTNLQAAMVRDMRATWETLAFDDQTSALELFTTAKVVVNADLARLYGIDATGLDANTFQVRSLPADGPRIGILAKAGFLSQFANQKEGSPTLRGKFMREALLCTHIQPPPGNVDTVLDDPPPDMPMTKRQRLEQHRNDDTCAGCHSMMDPLGLPLELFDAIGRYRTTELGLTIDPSGEFEEVPVADARELEVAVGSSAAVAQCIVRKYYSYALGYVERDVDGSVVNSLAASFQASGFKLRDLVLDVVTHDAFSAVAPQP